MDTLFRVEMFGLLSIKQGSQEIRRFRTQKTAALLAFLAFYKLRAHPRDVLLEMFWSDRRLDAARSNLSVALNALRHQLEHPGIANGAILIADRLQVRLNPDSFTTDVEEFEALLHSAEMESEADNRTTLLSMAADVYQGDLLPGFYDDWILTERDRLRDAYLASLRQVVWRYAETGQYERAIEYSHRMVHADPLREGAYHNLMRLYLSLGRPDDALHQYESLEVLLLKELQIAPSAPLRDFAEKLRKSNVARRASTCVRPAQHRQTGEVQERLQPMHASPQFTIRLPYQFNRFFGRESELAHLSGALEMTRRLITLTGPGGTGKARLSIEAGWRIKDSFQGSIWFVPLSELNDPLRLGEALRDTMELPRLSPSPALDQVISFLNERQQPCLLILDNFEQITSGGAPVVWTLLNMVPLLRCIVNSRRPLSLPGELEISILPLLVPISGTSSTSHTMTPSELLSFPSVALFVDRSQTVRPEFQITSRNAAAIAAICEKLEGIPLAIELAAARTRALSPLQLLERLAERFELLSTRKADNADRHRSLWDAIDWSYNLLSPDIQRFFKRLSVFRGGWSLGAAEKVCCFQVDNSINATPKSTSEQQVVDTESRKSKFENPIALDFLAQLRGHSLISAAESTSEIRFSMLDSIREFAAEKLQASGGLEIVKVLHQNWSMLLAEEAAPHLAGPDQAVWLQRLGTEYDNLRTALQFAADPATIDKEQCTDREPHGNARLRLAAALCRFWELAGHITEGRQVLALAMESPEANISTLVAAKAHNGAGMLALRQGDHSTAEQLFEKALMINRELSNRAWETLNLNNLGIVAYEQADYVTANERYNMALSISREIGNRATESLNLGNLGVVAFEQRQLVEARSFHEQALAICRELGDRFGEAMALYNLGNTLLAEEDGRSAQRFFEEALTIDRALGARYPMIHRFGAMASLALAQGRPERAARLYGAGEALREEIGAPIPKHERANYDRDILIGRNMFGAAAFDEAWSQGRTMSLSDAIDYALSGEDYSM